MRESWRRFYRKHREGFELLGDFLGALSVFVFLYCMYILLWLFQ